MIAKTSDLARIQEMYDIICQTERQMQALAFTRERFLNPTNDNDDLVAEGILNRVFRVAEEGGKLSDECADNYGFDRRGISGVRNRLAHVYGEVDRPLIWAVLTKDFAEIKRSCQAFCDNHGIDLHETGR